MTSSPFPKSITKTHTVRTGFPSEAGHSTHTATTAMTGTQKIGGLADLFKMPNMADFPTKKRGGGGGDGATGGLSTGNPALSRMSRAGGSKAGASVATKSRAGFS